MRDARSITPMLAAGLLMAASLGWAHEPEPLITLAEPEAGAYTIEGSFRIAVPASDVWDVLTDYDHITDFVKSMERSRVIQRFDDRVVVEQTAKGEFFVFSQTFHVLLETREKQLESIRFEDTSHKDFDHYSGAWTISEDPTGVDVHYHLVVKGKFAGPGFIKKRAMRRSAHKLMEQVRDEIYKRAKSDRNPR